MRRTLNDAVSQATTVLERLPELLVPLERLGEAMVGCWAGQGKVLICGNGGSMADAMHFAEELVVRYKKNRRALAALALADPTALTCAGNDFGYERVFSRQVEAFGNPGDLLIVLTTSGNSPNLLRAIEAAKEKRMKTVAFLGCDGGKARGMCDIELLIPSSHTARIQESQKLLIHVLCEWIDGQFE